MLCNPVRELFTKFFNCKNIEQHKAHLLLYVDMNTDDILLSVLLVYAVYQVYIIKRHSGASCKVWSSLFIEHANHAALGSEKLAPVWFRALKSRS